MIGLLRKRIDLLAPATAPDAAGGLSVDWAPSETVWAGVERLSSVRDLSGGGDRRMRRFAATIRFRPDLSPGGRVRFDGADYVIASIESADAKERRLILVCEEIPS
ncbi:MAG: hypothetical protein GC153_07370 [Alphaproteobacteria bacterium]|nr:hypothetical protein [Alphaproteobacteria bacterium]